MNRYIAFVAFMFLSGWMHNAAAADMVCVSDIDNDGYAGELGEARSCNANASSTRFYCPIDAVMCESESNIISQPTVDSCPDNYTLTEDGDFCVIENYEQTSPSLTCPSGYTYRAATNQCERRVTVVEEPDLGTEETYYEVKGYADTVTIYRGETRTLYWFYQSAGHPNEPDMSSNPDTFRGHEIEVFHMKTYSASPDSPIYSQIAIKGELAKDFLYAVRTPSGTYYTADANHQYYLSTLWRWYDVNFFILDSSNDYRAEFSLIYKVDTCPSGFTMSPDGTTCTRVTTVVTEPSISCPSGYGYNPSNNVCERTTSHTIAVTRDCPDDYSYNPSSGMCEITEASVICPLQGGGTCVTDSTNNQAYCSRSACFDRSTEARTDEIDGTMLVDNGERNEEGQCIDQLLVFSGRASECRRAGVDTAFKSCCNSDDVQNDSMGSLAQVGTGSKVISTVFQVTTAAYGAYSSALSAGATQGGAVQAATSAASNQVSALLNPATIAWTIAIYFVMDFIMNACNEMDIQTALEKDSGMCHEVGNYCKTRWLGSCVQEATSYCCYNSKMGRIIQEQGREQLSTFNGWGEPKSPDCRGFTPEEFRALDFSRIDLSEYYDELTHETQQNVQETIRQTTESYFETTQ